MSFAEVGEDAEEEEVEEGGVDTDPNWPEDIEGSEMTVSECEDSDSSVFIPPGPSTLHVVSSFYAKTSCRPSKGYTGMWWGTWRPR